MPSLLIYIHPGASQGVSDGLFPHFIEVPSTFYQLALQQCFDYCPKIIATWININLRLIASWAILKTSMDCLIDSELPRIETPLSEGKMEARWVDEKSSTMFPGLSFTSFVHIISHLIFYIFYLLLLINNCVSRYRLMVAHVRKF